MQNNQPTFLTKDELRSEAMLELKAEIEPGMHKKPIELLARDIRCEPLPPEIRMVIIAAWQRGRFLPRATIEQKMPSKLASKVGV